VYDVAPVRFSQLFELVVRDEFDALVVRQAAQFPWLHTPVMGRVADLFEVCLRIVFFVEFFCLCIRLLLLPGV